MVALVLESLIRVHGLMETMGGKGWNILVVYKDEIWVHMVVGIWGPPSPPEPSSAPKLALPVASGITVI